MKKIAIIGAGAVGSFYGARLQKAGHCLQYQTSHAALFRKKSLVIKSIWGNFSLKIKAFENTGTMDPADLAIVSTKALYDIDYKKILKPVISKKSLILVLQNGINFEEKIQKYFPKNPVIGGLAFTCINRNRPDQIDHIDYGMVRIGPLKKDYVKSAKLIADLFENSGVKVFFDFNLRRLRWEKLLWNVPFNPLSVITGGAATDKLIENPNTLNLVYKLMFEVRKIAKREGVPITKKAILSMVERTREMKPYKTSMLLDYEAGRKMEVEAILGEPIRIAKKLKIDVPFMESTYNLLSYYNEL